VTPDTIRAGTASSSRTSTTASLDEKADDPAGPLRCNAWSSSLPPRTPAPKRGKTMPWKTFLKAHFGVIAATDFFSIEVLTLGGLVRYIVWFVIDLESRRVHIAGLVRQPHDAWIQQIARNLTDRVDGFLRGKRYLIHDRDPLFTAAFRATLSAAECRPSAPAVRSTSCSSA
jgi:putative transposase